MFWNNLVMATNYFIEIAVELTVLFIGITFLVGLIQEYVPDETIKKALGGRHKVIGSVLGAGFGALTPFLLLLYHTASSGNAQCWCAFCRSNGIPVLIPLAKSSDNIFIHHPVGMEGSCSLLCHRLRSYNSHWSLAR